jgi:hypothetical protein
MPVRCLSDAELARLSGWPIEIAADDLVTFFTLTADELSLCGSTESLSINNRRVRGLTGMAPGEYCSPGSNERKSAREGHHGQPTAG